MPLTRRVQLLQQISGCWERDEVRKHTTCFAKTFPFVEMAFGISSNSSLSSYQINLNTNLSPTRCQGQRFQASLWDGIPFHSVSMCSDGEDLQSFVSNVMFFHSSNPVNFLFNSYHPNKRPIFNYFLVAHSPSQGRSLNRLLRLYTEL